MSGRDCWIVLSARFCPFPRCRTGMKWARRGCTKPSWPGDRNCAYLFSFWFAFGVRVLILGLLLCVTAAVSAHELMKCKSHGHIQPQVGRRVAFITRWGFHAVLLISETVYNVWRVHIIIKANKVRMSALLSESTHSACNFIDIHIRVSALPPTLRKAFPTTQCQCPYFRKYVYSKITI